jgi:cleavage and polyadenylation specificity factor subunit 3
MSRLKAALQREYEDDPNTKMELHNPRNTVAVELYFRGEKTAKVMGTLAMEKPKPGHKLSGILVKRNFNYHMLAACDLSSELEDSYCSCNELSCGAYPQEFRLAQWYTVIGQLVVVQLVKKFPSYVEPEDS